MKRIILSIAIMASMAGCAAMSALGGMGNISVDGSTFDQSTIVTMSPNLLYNDTGGGLLDQPSTKLGARWTSSAPGYIKLILSYSSSVGMGNSYSNITGLSINIDGKINSYKTNGSTRLSNSQYNSINQDIYTNSENSILISNSIFMAMMNAKSCRLRIQTSDGYEDAFFSAETTANGMPTAKRTAWDFINKVSELSSGR